nr:hypothetical protein [Gordonia hirsuta]
MLTLANEAAFLLADKPPAKGPEFGKASPIGLLVIVLLLVATFLLIRSMNKQLRKLPETFDADNPEPDQAFDDGTVAEDVPDPDAVADAAGAQTPGSAETRGAAEQVDEPGSSPDRG